VLVEAVGEESVVKNPDRVFHHPDKLPTPPVDWMFMAIFGLAVLVGLPVLIGVVFAFVLPWMGRIF
jgi:hypothetical protein